MTRKELVISAIIFVLINAIIQPLMGILLDYDSFKYLWGGNIAVIGFSTILYISWRK